MGDLILVDFKIRERVQSVTIEEKRTLVIEYYEDAYKAHKIKFKRTLTDEEVEFLYKRMRLLSQEHHNYLEYKFKVPNQNQNQIGGPY
jgi:uncharacterized protein YpmS